MADEESKSIPHELPSSHWLKATGQCVLERYLSATMARNRNTSHELSQPIELKSRAPLIRRDQRISAEKNGNRR